MKLRIVYLQQDLSVNGRNALAGRSLFDKFNELSDDIILGFCVVDDDSYSKISPKVKGDIISYDIIHKLKPNIIYLEGGLFYGDEGTWRIPRELAMELCQNGCTIIVADVDCNKMRDHKKHYKEATDFFKIEAKYINDAVSPVYGSDTSRFWQGNRQILCRPEKMIVSDWLRPIYENIPEIIVGLPVCFDYTSGSILASGNRDTTGILHLDQWVERVDPCPFASIVQHGTGFVSIIAGGVSSDVWLQGCQHNTTWLTNIAQFLVKESENDRLRRTSRHRSPKLLNMDLVTKTSNPPNETASPNEVLKNNNHTCSASIPKSTSERTKDVMVNQNTMPFEAYCGTEPFIFVSYSHADTATVFPEILRLHKMQYRIWYDEGIDPGNEWTEDIAEALNKCSEFIVYISPCSTTSQNVKNEINFALNKKKPFLAIHLEATILPQGLELRMGDIQAILRYRMNDDIYERKIRKVLSNELIEEQGK